MTDALAQVATYGYTADDRIASITYTGEQRPTPDVTFTYDPDHPRLASMATTGLGTISYTYVPINPADTVFGDGQLASASSVWGSVMSYSYDELGRIIGSPTATSVVYDALGRVESFANALGTFDPAYIGNSRRADYVNYPTGQKVDFDYHPNLLDKRLKEIQNVGITANVISQFNYLYDATGRITEWTQFDTEMSAAQKYELGHDDASQLGTADLKLAASGTMLTQSTFGYDAASNRTSEQIDAALTTWSPNSFNQLASQSGAAGARTFSYDLNGAMTSDGGTRTFEWNAAQRLHAINYTAVNARSEFSYDGLGRRVAIVEKNEGTVISEKRFAWEGMAILDERDASNVVQTQFFPQGIQLSAANYFYTRDHLGSIRELVGINGLVRARYDYDPYGERTKISGDADADFGFTGHYQHEASGLTLAPFRAYDANLGRWLSRDPIEESGGRNLYGYVLNDPFNGIDLLGLEPSAGWFDENLGTLNTKQGDYVVKRAGQIPGEVIRDFGVFAAGMLPWTRALQGVAGVVQFGKVANQVHHTFRHLEKAGVCRRDNSSLGRGGGADCGGDW